MGKNENVAAMATETIAGDLLGALIAEIRLLPDIWVKIGHDEQEEIIERLRKRVLDNVREGVRLIAAADRSSVKCELKKVVFADKVQAVLDLSKRDPAAMELAHAQGMACLIVTVDASQFTGGVDEVKADDDQLGLPGVDGDGTAGKVIEQARRRSKRKPDAPDPFQ